MTERAKDPRSFSSFKEAQEVKVGKPDRDVRVSVSITLQTEPYHREREEAAMASECWL